MEVADEGVKHLKDTGTTESRVHFVRIYGLTELWTLTSNIKRKLTERRFHGLTDLRIHVDLLIP